MVTCISNSPGETEALGETWGRAAVGGWCIALSGGLGAGKTQLVKGLARGLGIAARVHSPTFALVNVYPGGRLELSHLDLYRLDNPEQVVAAGLEEYLRPAGVTVIEWAERWFENPAPPREDGIASRGNAGPLVPNPVSGGHPLLRPGSLASGVGPGRLRCVWLEIVSDTARRVTYEDFGA